MRPPQRPTLDLTLPASGPSQNSAMPDIRSVLPWRSWDDGCREAMQDTRPMLVLAEPTWTNSVQRLALRLGQEPALTDLLASKVVPVLLDPDERPDLAANWRWAAMALTGTAGPPLMVFLTHEAQPFLAYCTMSVEGDDTYPSLASLVQSISDAYGDDPDAFRKDAVTLAESGRGEPDIPESGLGALRPIVDTDRGGLDELPKHPRPGLLWAALDAHARGDLPDDLVTWLRTTLNTMIRGGIYDQLDRGFHRCARDTGWVVPHFEKPIPLNAQLAAIYARAAVVFDDDTFRDTGRRVASFCMAAIGDGVDIIESDTTYYTWTAREVRTQLEPSLLQVVSLHYNIQPVDERQALYRAVESDKLDRYSHEDPDILRTRLMRGRAQMRAIRQRRPDPRPIALSSLAARATTLGWLLAASEWQDAIDTEAIVGTLDRLIEGRLDEKQGYIRAGEESAWLEDQAGLLAAFTQVHRATDDETWLDRGRELAGILMHSWWTDAGWLDRPDASSPSKAIIDDILPSALQTLDDAFTYLGAVTGEQRYVDLAAATRATQQRLATASGHWSAFLPRIRGQGVPDTESG